MTPDPLGVRAAAQQRRAATEQAILDATEALFEERPFWELNVEDVMATAGLGRTAFYRYFHDLESVVVRLMGGTRRRAARGVLELDLVRRRGRRRPAARGHPAFRLGVPRPRPPR